MKLFFTRMAGLGRAVALCSAAALVLALAACSNPTEPDVEEPEQYTITFDSHEGTVVTAITEDAGTAVVKPADPTRSGYSFKGWFSAATGGTLYAWPYTLNADVTMHAQWEAAPTEADQAVAEAFRANHAAILAKTAETASLNDEAAVDAALAAYANLSEAARGLLAEEYGKLLALKEAITALKPVITYTATANGSATETSTAINFAFSAPVDGLSANDITMVNATGSASKGALTGSGQTRSLAITVAAAGNVSVSIARTGIESAVKTVALYKAEETPPTQYTISFDSHEGTAVADIRADEGTAVAKPTDPTLNGYIFEGWHSAATGGALYSWPYTLNADVAMHAQWRAESEPEPTQHTITFDSHEGSAVAAIRANEGTAVAKPGDPTWNGYIFEGWHSAVTGGTLYSWPYTLSANMTMHAQWRAESAPEPTQYTITFDSHEGTAVAEIRANEGTAVAKPGDPTRDGYTFAGWHSAATGGTLYSWPYTLNANVAMHAQWREEAPPPAPQHTITFDSHGGGVVTAIRADEGTAVAKPADPTRDGYAFAGWHSAVTGGTAYTWPHTLSADVTMHGRWTPVSYTISYTLNNGTNAAGNPATYTIESAAITLAAATRANYTFGGWFDNATFTGTAVTTIAAGSSGAKAFYARWTATSYSITYNLDGGTNADGNPASYTVESAAITLADPTRTGYDFGGWFEQADFTGTAVTTIAAGSSGAKAFYAQWTAIPSYAITYNLNGGTNAPGNPATYTAVAAVTLAAPIRAGYIGTWHDNVGLAGSAVASIPLGTTGPKEFWAKWVAITYTVAYRANGGEGAAMQPSPYTYGTAAALAANTYTRADFSFGSWNTQQDGGGTSYGDGQTVNNLTATQGATVDLYAQWRPDVPASIAVWVNEDGNILVSNDDVTISKGDAEHNSFGAEVTGAYAGIQWNLNGDPVFGSRGTMRSIAIKAADYVNGKYYLGVTVTKGGVTYSTAIHFTVTN
jgi:uncharacterized repeat protein (TIGR02543 family)